MVLLVLTLLQVICEKTFQYKNRQSKVELFKQYSQQPTANSSEDQCDLNDSEK
jgi:hypothetical protein